MSAAGQIPLALAPPRRLGFDNFLAGPNRMVVETLKDGLEPGQWYFLRGGHGSGRTHLALATAGRLGQGAVEVRYLPLGRPETLGLLDDTRADWVVLDDVDALAGDRDAELGLFNALNRWRAERSGLLMTGAGLDGFGLPDLKSRLGQAVRLKLKPLDEAELVELVARLAADHQVALGRGAVAYLISRAPRNAGELAGIINRLARRALSERRVVSVPLVRQVLGDY